MKECLKSSIVNIQFSILRLFAGYSNNKSRAYIFFGFDRDLSMVFINNFLGNHQPNAGTLRSLGGKKPLENVLFYFRIHSAAIILDSVYKAAAPLWPGPNHYFFLARAGGIGDTGINGIGYQIQQAAINKIRIKVAGVQLV